MRIRPAEPADLPALQSLERAAGAAFRSLGMDRVADDDPPSLATLSAYRSAGGLWVTADGSGPAAYVLHEPLDGAIHVEQLSVHPSHARQGLGRALLSWVATRTGLPLTLTTFTDVPWNAPYYARIGFRTLADAELTPGLRRARAHEASLGLDAWPRVCMRRDP
ncbi:GNAT family N-acetyltransferase [Streptomyces sp. NPDC060194]|uniref:GNAT family N-acetyltransferase n=1 Tax=Streptomyces sp. NPDC060194 TaxID=3347069 RepID=UPI003667B1E7